jgi:excisionase family DNA binding protein
MEAVLVNRLMTCKEIADLWQVHESTVYRLVQDGKLRGIRLGRSVRIDPREVEAYLAKLGVPRVVPTMTAGSSGGEIILDLNVTKG